MDKLGGETMNDLLDKLNTLEPGGFWARVSGTFDRMTIAEDEIEKAQARHPECSDRIWGSFKILCASQLSGYPDVVYQAHCGELLDRVAEGVDTTLGTKAEVMIVCAQASLAHPPNPTVASLYAQLFSEIFPDLADTIQDMLAPNAWVNLDDVHELLGTLRDKARVNDRVLKE
jgi:hypothetical protein